MICCVVIKSQRLFEPCRFPSPNISVQEVFFSFSESHSVFMHRKYDPREFNFCYISASRSGHQDNRQ